jgi:hypothetical protein
LITALNEPEWGWLYLASGGIFIPKINSVGTTHEKNNFIYHRVAGRVFRGAGEPAETIIYFLSSVHALITPER